MKDVVVESKLVWMLFGGLSGGGGVACFLSAGFQCWLFTLARLHLGSFGNPSAGCQRQFCCCF